MNPGSNEQKEMSREMDKLISGPNCTGLKEHFNLKESVFASENMRKFADILGIKNAVTSYEYLAQGEIDNIIGWQDFIRIS